MSPFSAGDTGPLAAPGHSGAQGPEHGAWRGEQVWCHQLPILLPAVSERLLLPGPCVSVSPPVSPIRPCVSPFFLPGEAASLSQGLMSSLSCKSPEESLGKQGAPSAGGADVCLRQGRGGLQPEVGAQGAAHTPLPPSSAVQAQVPGALSTQPAPVLLHQPHRSPGPIPHPPLFPDRLLGRLRAWQALSYA